MLSPRTDVWVKVLFYLNREVNSLCARPRILAFLVPRNKLQMPAHPVGKQEKRAVVFRPPAVSSIYHEWVTVPFHDGALLGGQQGHRLTFAEPVEARFPSDVPPVRIQHRPRNEI